MRSKRRAWWRVGPAIVLGLVACSSTSEPPWLHGKGKAAATEAEVKEADRLRAQVDTRYKEGKYDDAVPLAERALALREKALGPDNPKLAPDLNRLAELYKARGEYDHAEPYYVRARAIDEKALGPNHPDVATDLNNLAGLYYAKGEFARAEPYYERARAIDEKALGPNHPDVATDLNNLAALYRARGESARAEPLYEGALAIREKALGRDHRDVATSLNNLAELYSERAEYEHAEPLLQRALAIREKALGPDHPDVATSLNNLAGLYDARGEYERAEPLLQRALTIDEKVLGPSHPDVATSLNNLAGLYHAREEYAQAEPLYRRALAIRERALGPGHPDVATSLSNLSVLYWATGQFSKAISADNGAQSVEESMVRRLVSIGSESQKFDFLRLFLKHSYGEVTLALDTRNALAEEIALLTLFRRKGRALDAMARSVHALRARLGPEEQTLFDELSAARSRYATLSLRGSGSTPLDAYRHDLATLNERIRKLEDVISRRSEAFKAGEQPVTVDAVRAALLDGAALVEWVLYEPFNPKAHTERERWRPRRYAASVLSKRAAPRWIDLGDAETIDADVQSLRNAFSRPANKDADELARALEAKVMAPVRALLGTTRKVFLSPDGALNLIPFAALVGENGRPLIERYAFTYVTSGRDLLRRAVHAAPRGAPIVVTNPDFNEGAPSGGPFPLLLHGDEVRDTVAARFQHPAAAVLTGKAATKAQLLKVAGPAFLHLDSHGYFKPDVCTSKPPDEVRGNPLLQSGIALAGANACNGGNPAGLLTASEASGLDLYGTRLVVLAACETGVGEPDAGNGVYGLRRALVLAGAETQVMSLWPVDGAATAKLMKEYYERLANGEGRSEAMRQVQLAMLYDRQHEHPYYWASFIVSGDDRSLDGTAVEPDLRVHPGGDCTCRAGAGAPDGGAWWLAGAGALVATSRILTRRRRARRSRTE